MERHRVRDHLGHWRERLRRKPESNLSFSTTFAELGIDGPRQTNLGVEFVPTSILHIPDGDSTVHIAVINDSFKGDKLSYFLESAAPYRYDNPFRIGTINDLNLPDLVRRYQAQQRKVYIRERNRINLDPDLIRVNNIHRTSPVTREVYDEFDQNNRPQVLRALEDVPKRIGSLLDSAQQTRYIDDDFGRVFCQELLDKYINEYQGSDPVKARESGLWYLAYVLRNAFHTDTSFDTFALQHPGKEPWEIVESYITSDDPSIKDPLYQYALASSRGHTLIHKESGLIQREGEMFSPEITREVRDTGEVVFSADYQGQTIGITLEQSGPTNSKSNWRITNWQIPPDSPHTALSPVIAYRVSDNQTGDRSDEERRLLTQPELQRILKQNNIVLPYGMVPDVSLGRMALAYFSPDVVESIDKAMALFHNPKAKRQALKGAQSLILYAVSRYTSKFYRESGLDGPADMLLTPSNPVIAAIENVN